MKSGETGFLKARITPLEMDVVASIIFTLKREDGLFLKKIYPDEVAFDGEYFMIPLDQRETNKMRGTYRIEAQVNFVDKNVLKTNALVNYIGETLGTEYLKSKAGGQEQALFLEVAEAHIIRSGEGGTSDYNQLMNQPKINGVTLKGNKTFEELGLDTEIDTYIEAHKDELKGDKGDKGEKGDQGVKGDKGDQGIQGIQGEKGADGRDGVDGTNGRDGKDGQNGADGFSPSAKVERVTNGAKITITDKDGTTEAIVNDGSGGSGGTTDYSALTNKPSINNVTLDGNKTLVQLGVDAEIASYVNAHKSELKGDKGDDGKDYVITEADYNAIADVVLTKLPTAESEEF